MFPDNATARQFELLDEISRILTGRLQWWLFGGWAMDFHAVTRAHSDIEFFVRTRDARLVSTLLQTHGYAAPAPLYPDEGQPYLKDGQEIGAWFVEGPGPAHTLPGRWAGWALPDDSFPGSAAALVGVTATPVSLACLIEMKRGFAAQPHGAPMRPRDADDLRLLEELQRT